MVYVNAEDAELQAARLRERRPGEKYASLTTRCFDMKFAFKLLLVTLTLCAFPFGFVAAGLHAGLSLGYRALHRSQSRSGVALTLN